MVTKASLSILLCLWLATAGCEKSANQTANTAQTSSDQATTPTAVSRVSDPSQTQRQMVSGKAGIEVCALLTPDELKSIQGEAPTESKASMRADGTLTVSQCVYVMPTYSKSVSLELTMDSSDQMSHGVRQLWKERFPEADEVEKAGRERDREKGRGKESEDREGEAENQHPLKVTGIGDAAFWTGNTRAGALYVLTGDAILRLSVGGPEDVNEKIRKLKSLSRNALGRLK